MTARLKALLAAYGPIAAMTYAVIFVITFAGLAAAIRAGWAPRGAAAGTGLLVAAWVGTKVTQPVRILATVALTPLVARWLRRPGRAGGAEAEPTAPPR